MTEERYADPSEAPAGSVVPPEAGEIEAEDDDGSDDDTDDEEGQP